MTAFVRDMQIGEMISVSMHWIDSNTKPVFLSIPELAPLFPRVVTTHANLVAARDSDAAAATVHALSDEAASIDDVHDNRARALFYVLLAAYYHEMGKDSPDTARAEALDLALGALFPTRLSIILASYQAEAGNAAQIEKLATSDYADLLASVTIDANTSAKALAIELSAAGQKLGAIEASRPKVVADAKEADIAPAEVRQRMRAWASLAETILGVLDQSNAPAAAIDAIRAPLLAAAEKATARRRAKRAAKTNAPNT